MVGRAMMSEEHALTAAWEELVVKTGARAGLIADSQRCALQMSGWEERTEGSSKVRGVGTSDSDDDVGTSQPPTPTE